MLKELLNINLSEPETISLLDIPSSVSSEDADGAEAQRRGKGSRVSFLWIQRNDVRTTGTTQTAGQFEFFTLRSK